MSHLHMDQLQCNIETCRQGVFLTGCWNILRRRAELKNVNFSFLVPDIGVPRAAYANRS